MIKNGTATLIQAGIMLIQGDAYNTTHLAQQHNIAQTQYKHKLYTWQLG